MNKSVSNLTWQRALWTCVVLVILNSLPIGAQFDTAVVLGTVRDGSGAVVPAASVTLKNTETGITANVISDENGNYQFFNVRIGSYDVSAELQGFSTAIVKSVGVTVNARQRVDLTLQVSNVNTEVVVTSEAQLLETDSSERGQVIDREQIVNLPLNGRSYSNLSLIHI